MRYSQLLMPTLKEIPADAELVSHQLMLRAGLIRKVAAGIYNWLPLGLKVLRKVENIVREEMNAIDAQELLLPAVHPKELWEETGRWSQYGNELLKITDRHQREFCFGPTHEEIITDLMRNELKSYKELPLTVFQVQTKFRDEIRPRFGVMRAREFIMKDAYSFHLNQASLQETYQKMYQAYCRIFQRLGLNFRAVEADTGSIGGYASHEFQVLANSGEDVIAISDSSDYAANVELANAKLSRAEAALPNAVLEKKNTPNQRTITQVAEFLQCPANKMVKTLLVEATSSPAIAIILRGDHELNLVKAEKIPGIAKPVKFLEQEKILPLLNCEPGSLGPVNLKLPVFVDHEAAVLSDFACGANQTDYHYIGVNWNRDCRYEAAMDLRMVVEGDPSPDGQGKLKLVRGIEVGHIFQLGKKYSEALSATVLNEHGDKVVLDMGCYGIGVSRIVAAAIEQHHDQHGIIWPKTMAPFDIVILPLNHHKNPQVLETAHHLYDEMRAKGLDVLLDDRDERPGVKFADADLIGIPQRLIISEKTLAEQKIEYRLRYENCAKLVPLDNIIDICLRERKNVT